MGRQKNNKAESAQKDNTPTNLLNSRETGHFSEPENKRPSMTTSPTTPVLTADVAALTSGEVVSVLTGATAQGPPDSLKNTPPFVMAGNQDAFQMSGCTHLSAVDLQDGGGGDRSAGVSHAAGPLLTHNAHSKGLMGVTTPQRGKQRDDYEGQSKDKYALFEAERAIRQQLELLDQKDLHTAAAHAEAIGEANAEANAEAARARAEADRVIAEASAKADRAIAEASAKAERIRVGANRARAESDRAVARERLLLRQQLAALTNQPYPVDTPTKIKPKHGKNDTQP